MYKKIYVLVCHYVKRKYIYAFIFMLLQLKILISKGQYKYF